MTVDGFAYHYHPHHHPHHHHPHQSPGHQQESSLFLPFSIFHFPSSFTFFHLGELGQPNHVQFRVTVTVMTVIFYFFCIFPVVVQGSGKTKKLHERKRKKSNLRPISRLSSITYCIHGWELSTERKENTAGAIIAHFWVVVELVLFIFYFFLLLLCILFLHFHR